MKGIKKAVNVIFYGGTTVNTNKLKEALAELTHQRAIFDGAISQLQNIIATVDAGVSQKASDKGKEVHHGRATSYVDDTVKVLELSGQPLHIAVIAQKIGEMRGRTVPRASVESSVIRHISSLGNRARITKVRRAHFGLSSWKAIPQIGSAA